MPPEAILHNHYTGESSTVFTLGIILFEMLTGENLYDDSIDILCKNVPEHSNISENARNLILRCLERNVSERITFDEILQHVWLA